MAAHATGSDGRQPSWRPRPLGLFLIGAADFCGAVGLGNLLLGQAATVWLIAAAALLLAGISASD
jgi:hypothetical protein